MPESRFPPPDNKVERYLDMLGSLGWCQVCRDARERLTVARHGDTLDEETFKVVQAMLPGCSCE